MRPVFSFTDFLFGYVFLLFLIDRDFAFRPAIE